MALEYSIGDIGLFINSFIVCASSLLLSAYVYCKSRNISLKKLRVVYLIAFGVIVSLLYAFIRFYSVTLAHFTRFILIPVLLSGLSKDEANSYKDFAVGFISLGFVSVCETISLVIEGTVYWLLGDPREYIYTLVTIILVGLLCFLFMRVKRFRRGFLFFQEDKYLGVGVSISAIIMIVKSLNIREHGDEDYLFLVLVWGCVIAGFGLYLWIRRSITAHYRERLQLKSEEHYQEMLAEREKEIVKLNQSNEYLAKIVHRDNHLMGSLDSSINAYLNSTDETGKDNLLREIQTLAKERAELIAKEQLDSKLLPATGNHLIDGAINDLYIKSAARGIDFNLTVSATVDEIIGKYLSQTELQTLLCDHIKDAVTAVESRGEAGGKIFVNLSKQNDHYCIDIYDNGVEFSIDTLSKLGLERVTTHPDTGGSGVGFMTTFATLQKACAGLIITEFEPNGAPFTKSVAFRFDGKSGFIIRSYRAGELQEGLQRNDVTITG